jgi:MFS family permease
MAIPMVRTVVLFMLTSSLAFGLMFGAFGAYVSRQFGAAELSLLLSLFYFARLPGSVLSGALADRLGLIQLLAGIFALAGAGLLLASLAPSFLTLALAVLLLGFQQATAPVVAMALAGKLPLPGARHITYFPLFAAAELGVAVALTLTLLLQELFSNLAVVFFSFGVIYLVGALGAARLKRKLIVAPAAN